MSQVESKIAVLENEVNQMRGLFSKLDESIDKMAEISGAIQQMLAVHETQIQSQAQDTEDLFHLVEKRRIENDENLKELHSRITTNGKETRKEMNENVIKIMNAIEDVKDLMVDRERIINEQQPSTLRHCEHNNLNDFPEQRQWHTRRAHTRCMAHM